MRKNLDKPEMLKKLYQLSCIVAVILIKRKTGIQWQSQFTINRQLARLQNSIEEERMNPSIISEYLRQLNFTGTYLGKIVFKIVILEGANLIRADLSKANLLGAILRGGYLEDADLLETNLEEINLRGANLEWTYLDKAILDRKNLKHIKAFRY